MALNLGAISLAAFYLGSTAISTAYLGATQIYSAGVADAYAIGGASPELVASFTLASDGTTEGEYFRTSGVEDDFSMFSFSRASNATMFDSTGTLVYAPHNLNRDTFYPDTAGWWRQVGVTYSASAETAVVADDTMILLTEDTGTNHRTFLQDPETVLQIGVPARFGIVAKTNGRSIQIWDNYGVTEDIKVNLTNGTLISQSAGVTDYGIEDLGDGKYYIWFEAIPTTRDTRWGIRLCDHTGSNTYTGDGSSGVYIYGPTLQIALGGNLAVNPDDTATASGTWVQVGSGTANYLSRRDAYYHNGTSWVKGGLQLESRAATQLLHGTDSFATQTETVTAQAYTLQFRGTGSIALTGAHTATLSGTGANDLVSLTFTPSAGTLTLTPLGTVDYPQLETGSAPTSYIPNTAGSGTVTRAAETLSIAGADTPANTTAISISMKGLLTYADQNLSRQVEFFNQQTGNDFIRTDMRSDVGSGRVDFENRYFGLFDYVSSGTSDLSPGVNNAFNLGYRVTTSALNGALNGTSYTENTTLSGIVDHSASPMEIASLFTGFISEFRMWGADIGNTGIEEVTA